MSIVFDLGGFDKLFNETATHKLIVNDYDGRDIAVSEHINKLLLHNIVGDNLSLIPSCMCGELKGNYYLGEVCTNPSCGTVVKSVIDEKLTYLVWIRQPKGVAKLITPFVWNILLNRYKIASPKVALVEYLTQTNMRITGRNLRNYHVLEKLDYILKTEGIQRGYNSFVNNFMRIIEILEYNFVSTGSKAVKAQFIEWVRQNHHKWFSGYIPVPNRSLFVLDTSDDSTYVDKSTIGILNAVRSMTGIDIHGYSLNMMQNKTSRCLSEFAKFYKSYFETKIFKKPGLIRKHITRARSHFTIRAVVTSITTQHRHDEIFLPWSAGCSAFREHILRELMLMGYSYRHAVSYFMTHINKYSPIIDDIFIRLIEQTKGGFPAILNRNPSLHRGSLIFVKIPKIKTDPEDNTLSVSYLNSPSLNMDFDGDMLHVTLLFTKGSIREAENFKLSHNVLNLRGPNEFSSVTSLPKSNVATLANWLDSEFNETT